MDQRFDLEESQASFRGATFHVKKRSRDGGRRGPTHEAPQRDEPDGEDLGRKVRVFKVDGLVIGTGSTDAEMAASCRKKTVALLEALEDKAGPGIYRDPWHGQWKVICRSYSATDDEDRQFVAILSLTFEEAGDTRYPLAAQDTAAGVEKSADALSKASSESLLRTLSVKGRPQYVLDAAHEAVSSAMSELSDAGLPQLDTTAAIGIVDAGAQWRSFASSMPGNLTGEFGGDFARLFRGLSASSYSRRGGLGDAQAARTAFAGMSNYGADLPAVTPTTASRQAQAANQAAIVNATRRLAVSEEARALAASKWESQDQAISQRDETLAHISAIKAIAGANGDDAVFAAASALEEAVIADVAARAPAAKVRTTTMDAVLPARVVAHKLLGDGRKADDIVRRNGISNPAFVPATKKLEYLSDG